MAIMQIVSNNVIKLKNILFVALITFKQKNYA